VTSYRKDIDGLRAVAVLAVVLFHAAPGVLPGGFIGVDVFFVISGFLISSIILDDLNARRFSLLNFYERRIRRIFPALFFMLAVVTVFAAALLLPPDLKDYGQSLAAVSVSLSNFMFWMETGYFSVQAFQKPLLHTWSLGVEEQFYMVFPLFLLLVFKCGAQKFLLPLFSVIFAAALAASAWLTSHHPEFAFYMPMTRAWELLLGAMIALNVIPALNNKAFNDALSVLGLVLIAASCLLYSGSTAFPGIAAVMPCLGAGLVIFTGQQRETPAGKFLSLRFMVFTGLISYSLYLWHWPFFSLYRYYKYDELAGQEIVLIIAASFLAAFLSWKYIEQPFRGRNALLGRKQVYACAAIAVAAAIIAGAAFHIHKGLPARFGETVNAAIAARSQNNPRHAACLLEGTSDELPPLAPCLFGATESGRYDIVIWGDSQADHWVPGLEARAAGEEFSGRQITKAGCPPLPGAVRVESGIGAREDCARFNDKALQLITDDPHIKTVILSGRWTLYTEDTQSRLGEAAPQQVYLTDSPSSEASRENSRRVFRESLEKVAGALRSAGKNVIIIGPMPEPGYNVPDCLARAESGKYAVKSCMQLPRDDADRRASFVNQALQEIQASYPGIVIFFPVEKICDNTSCALSHDGRPLYMDDNHLSAEGAKYIAGFIRLP